MKLEANPESVTTPSLTATAMSFEEILGSHFSSNITSLLIAVSGLVVTSATAAIIWYLLHLVFMQLRCHYRARRRTDGLPIVMNDRAAGSDHWTRLRVNYWQRAVYG